MRLAFPGLMAALADGVTIVTPTPTLASVAVEQFDREQLSRGNESWERPGIHSLDVWMTNCWQDARFASPNAPSLLSLSQEREVWRQIIEADRSDLFDLRAMASLAQKAARVIAEYQIPTEGEGWSEHADAREFLRWHQTMQRRLKAENWITRADLWRMLPPLLAKGAVNCGPVAFVALVAVSPGLKNLSRALGDSVRNVGISYSHQPAGAPAIPFESTDDEMNHAARAVRYLLETEKISSISVLVADLKSHAGDLLRVFKDVLYPNGEAGAHLHIQTGRWIEHPVISNALLLLELAQERIHQASAGAILRSPFIDGARTERSARAMADTKLRKARELDYSEAEIEKAVWDCPILYQILGKIFRAKRKLMPSMRLPAWSAAFSDILQTAKWPAIEHITEEEQRAVDRWNNALSELASLGLVAPPVSLSTAISHLRSILSAPMEAGNWSSPVHFMDANSCEGIEFDRTFLMNMSEEAWPAASGLSPLIPYALQRAHQIPASRPESLVEERERKTHALLASATQVTVTYSGNLTPLLRHAVQITPVDEEHEWAGATVAQSFGGAELDVQMDERAPALQQSNTVHGGAGIIKSQSLCAFRAFAEYRLNARGEDEASIGFDALERGECAHKALEDIWRELGNQQALKALRMEDLRLLVEKHVEQAVKDDAASGPIRALTSQAERERLVSVILQWLSIERDRARPFTVEMLEDNREVDLAGLKLKLRMDRVDRLPDGSLILIDYKSGVQSYKKLLSDRPKEPQLLVYAAVMDEPVHGLYFGELRNRRARPVGQGAEKHFPKQLGTKQPADWDAFLQTSKETVQRLAVEFQQGHAEVAPSHGACAYCKVKPICRIGALSAGEDEEE
jgi:probable DNA repair protein